MINFKTVYDDIFAVTSAYNKLSGDLITIHPIRKDFRLIDARLNVMGATEGYYTTHFTPGIRITYNSQGLYPASFIYLRLLSKAAKAAMGCIEGGKKFMLQKRSINKNLFIEFENFIHTDVFDGLRFDVILFSKIKLIVWGLLDMNASVITAGDRINIDTETQKRLSKIILILLDDYESDIGMADHILSEIYRIDCGNLITKLRNIASETRKYASTMQESQPFDGYTNSLASKLKSDLKAKIQGLHFNDEFPVLICEIFSAMSYEDIVLTQDTRDGGIDIWLNKHEKTDSGELEENIHLVSCKKYSSNLSTYEIEMFINDLKPYMNGIPHLVSASAFSRKAGMMLTENKIQKMDINDIVTALIQHKIGINRNYNIDEEYWKVLISKKAVYREGPLYKYPVKTVRVG